jgi:hypothetical protein
MRWFTRKTKPDATAQHDRYAGKPLLLILDNYVLSCIGHLTADKDDKLRTIVQQAFGGGSDWKQTVRAVLHLEDVLDDRLRRMWMTNQERARQAGVTPSAELFARAVVDENFAHLLDE